MKRKKKKKERKLIKTSSTRKAKSKVPEELSVWIYR